MLHRIYLPTSVLFTANHFWYTCSSMPWSQTSIFSCSYTLKWFSQIFSSCPFVNHIGYNVYTHLRLSMTWLSWILWAACLQLAALLCQEFSPLFPCLHTLPEFTNTGSPLPHSSPPSPNNNPHTPFFLACLTNCFLYTKYHLWSQWSYIHNCFLWYASCSWFSFTEKNGVSVLLR